MRLKFVSRIYSHIARYTVERFSQDLDLALQLEARDSSARYAASEMGKAMRFPDRDSLLREALRRTTAVPGCICEFGVWTGNSLRILADTAPDKEVHGFDSFEGLPADWRPSFTKGTFKTSVPVFRQANVRLHKGWFDATLPPFFKEFKQPISLAHIDCDIYSSARTVLEYIVPRLALGAVLVFDEYFNYPGWEEHEHKALLEAARAHRLGIHYLGFNHLGQQVMVGMEPKARTRQGVRRT